MNNRVAHIRLLLANVGWSQAPTASESLSHLRVTHAGLRWRGEDTSTLHPAIFVDANFPAAIWVYWFHPLPACLP
jgi:hypothetical protein